jgi:hypothetical protein
MAEKPHSISLSLHRYVDSLLQAGQTPALGLRFIFKNWPGKENATLLSQWPSLLVERVAQLTCPFLR